MRKNLESLCNEAVLRKMIHDAAGEVERYDRRLLALNASERSIAHRFAIYLEDYLYQVTSKRIYQVDCEYNRIGLNVKCLSNRYFRYALEAEPEIYDEAANRIVVPDVIVHRRGRNGPNLMAMEIKTTHNLDAVLYRKGERVGTERDTHSIRCLVTSRSCPMPTRHWSVSLWRLTVRWRNWTILLSLIFSDELLKRVAADRFSVQDYLAQAPVGRHSSRLLRHAINSA